MRNAELFPGFTTWLMLVPDVETTADANNEAIALGANFGQDWGRVTGIVWTRKDKEGTGYRISGLYNVVPGTLTLYASYGKRPGDTEPKYQVVGVNISGLATATGWNPYIEYDIYNKAIGFYVSKTLTTNTSFAIYLTQTTTDPKEWKLTPYLTFSF